MKLQVYDIEVYAKDWIVVFRDVDPDKKEYAVFHNDNHGIREYLRSHKNLVIGGFNNKHYDDGILHAIYHGADPETVKKMNDFIIGGKGRWWEFDFVQYKKKMFKSFDLRDDLPINLSLKAIEGNLGGSIIEEGVDFDIGRKLTDKEVEDTIRYCKADTDATAEIYQLRKGYLETKVSVGGMKGIPPEVAIGMTNAKLTAKFLEAEKVPRYDEQDYPLPPSLRIDKYTDVLDFFRAPVDYTLESYHKELSEATTNRRKASLKRRIKKLEESRDIYDCKLTTYVAGVRHIYAWGGIHGARSKYIAASDSERSILLIDVGSYYPSMMLHYDYISRNIPSSEGFADVYVTRMKAKNTGDSKVSNDLKLVLNTTYGAMKNRYNDLYDPRNANAICVGGQVLLTDLIEKLEVVEGFELVQSNTDGIMISVPRKKLADTYEIVSEWEERTKMNMEYVEVLGIVQKDVNNYVMKTGAVFEIKDGKMNVLYDGHKSFIETKGGYVSLHAGGDYRNNSLVVVHKALVNYFMNGIPVEETIRSEKDPINFQIIAKTGGTYDRTEYHYDGKAHDTQRVNRVYASKDKKAGTIYKIKEKNGEVVRRDKIANLPDHCLIDNEGKAKIEDIDLDFYIDMAKDRIVDYVGVRKKDTKLVVPDKSLIVEQRSEKEMSNKKRTLYQKLNDIRLEFINAEIKKSGVNLYAEYKYFTLEDIIPIVLELNKKHNVTTIVSCGTEEATLTMVDLESDDTIVFRSPMVYGAIPKGATEIQNLGAVQTYMRRYLYMLYLEVVEADAYDLTLGRSEEEQEKAQERLEKATTPKTNKVPAAKKTHSNRPASPKQREAAKEKMIDKDGKATATQVRSIKAGLKKLRDSGEDYEDYIKKVAISMKKGLNKKQAEKVLLDIGDKVKKLG